MPIDDAAGGIMHPCKVNTDAEKDQSLKISPVKNVAIAKFRR